MYCKVVFDVPLDRDFDYAVPDEYAAQVQPGVRVTAPFGRMLTTGLVVSVSEQTSLSQNILIKPIASVVDKKPLFGSDLFSLAQFMKKTWGGPIGQILFSLVPPQPYFKRLESHNPPPFTPAVSPALSPDQQQVLQQLQPYLESGFNHVLLSGVAGSGKTKIILQLAQQVLQQYGQVLLTLPDVLAAQQWMFALQQRFGEEWVFGWHSKMLLSQKKQIYSHISNGLPCILVSARSGGLLPFKNLRLAAMLEEESEHYKQEENKPYFHLRDLLHFRCRQHQALFISCSDTPSLETIHALQEGGCELLHLSTPTTMKPCQIHITAKKSERSKLFSDKLLDEIQQNLEQKQVSLLLLNRRGYANAYYCLNCGAYAKCKKCGAILVREKDKENQDRLLCKKCGHVESLEQTCPQCQNKIFKSRGGGTQKIVTELSKLYPTARILRLDSNTLKNKDGQGYQVRRALEQEQTDIIVGTRQAIQCVHSPRVTLAAVLDAELELDSPDFRAGESFGQLLFKLKDHLSTHTAGRLLVQTASSAIFPFELLHEEYAAYAEEEMAARESFNYPPFIELVKVQLKSKEGSLLTAETARFMTAAAPFATDILGPVKTGKKTDILQKQYILCKVLPEKYNQLIELADHWQAAKKTELKLTADPYDFY